MDRRAFIGVVTGGLLAAPLAAQAQQAGKVWRIGFLTTTPFSPETSEAFARGLRERDWVEGQNIQIERRYAEAHAGLEELASELVRIKVDVIVAATTPAALAVKKVTNTVPIVIITASDPVATMLVSSLARPGGNVTGLSSQAPDLAAKALQLLKEATGGGSNVAILCNPKHPAHQPVLREAETAARALRMRVQSFPVQEASELDGAFSMIVRKRPDAVWIFQDPVTTAHRQRIVNFTAGQRLPSMYFERAWVLAGGLMSFSPDWADQYRRAGTYIDKLLRGTKPADLPVEQPTKFELVINLKTAKALGLTIPPSLLLRADQVIE